LTGHAHRKSTCVISASFKINDQSAEHIRQLFLLPFMPAAAQ